MGLFITFEGIDGSGKSTQVRLLAERLQGSSSPVLVTREPGGTRIGEQIREQILAPTHQEMAATTEVLLFSAARAQIVAEVIRPHLERGGIVLCDRFADSTYSYQGYGRGQDLQTLRSITQIATDGLNPDHTIFLDLPVAAALQRKQRAAATDEWNRLDAEAVAFHERVRAGYHALIDEEPARWLAFDAQIDPHQLASQIWQRIEPFVEQCAHYEKSTT